MCANGAAGTVNVSTALVFAIVRNVAKLQSHSACDAQSVTTLNYQYNTTRLSASVFDKRWVRKDLKLQIDVALFATKLNLLTALGCVIVRDEVNP